MATSGGGEGNKSVKNLVCSFIVASALALQAQAADKQETKTLAKHPEQSPSVRQAIKKVEPLALLPNLAVFSYPRANMTFSGTVQAEDGRRYHYFFSLSREHEDYQADSFLYDESAKTLLLDIHDHQVIKEPPRGAWYVGDSFLKFNRINGTWVFGVSGEGHKGFNFKVDTVGTIPGSDAKVQLVRKGMSLRIGNTGRLNGHIYTAGGQNEEQFVTAKRTWFRKIWLNQHQTAKRYHHLETLQATLCDFDDGSGFYTMKLKAPDVFRGAIAGWRDRAGQYRSMSQFVSVQQAGTDWRIRVPGPQSVRLAFKNQLAQEPQDKTPIVFGSFALPKPGFCVISYFDPEEAITPIAVLSTTTTKRV